MMKSSAKEYRLEAIAEKVGAVVKGNGNLIITGVNTLADAIEGQISFLTNPKYRGLLATTQASAVIVDQKQTDDFPFAVLLSANPHATFAKVVQMFDTTPPVAEGISPSAHLGKGVKCGARVSIGHNAVIEEGVDIGDDVQIGANCFIGRNAVIGANTVIHPNVSIYHAVSIGRDVVVHSQSVIGAPGFGYANEKGTWLPIPQLGAVTIGDSTQIGAAVTIDRGALGDTQIGTNVIIDDQVHIAHNCIIGDHSCICGTTGMAGSCHIGKHVIIAGGCVINGHISICDNVQITGFTMVVADITEPGVYSSGQPAMENREWRRNVVRLKQIDSLYQRVKTLEQSQTKVTP